MVEVRTCDPCSTSTAENDLHSPDRFSHQLKGVEQCSTGDYRRPMLVIVEHGYVHLTFEFLLNVKALRCFDIFKVDPAEGWLQCLDNSDNFLTVMRVQLDVEHVNICKPFEEDTLALHDRLPCKGSNISQAKNGTSVRDYRNKVPFCGVPIDIIRICLNLAAWFGNARSVGERQISLRRARLRDGNLYLSSPSLCVIIKCILLTDHVHFLRVKRRSCLSNRCSVVA